MCKQRKPAPKRIILIDSEDKKTYSTRQSMEKAVEDSPFNELPYLAVLVEDAVNGSIIGWRPVFIDGGDMFPTFFYEIKSYGFEVF